MGACLSNREVIGASGVNTRSGNREESREQVRSSSRRSGEVHNSARRITGRNITEQNNNGNTPFLSLPSLDRSSTVNELEYIQRELARMENFFQSLLGQAYEMGVVDSNSMFNLQQEPGTRNSAPPPASQNAIRLIPIVAITAEDLVDENNRECCICFDENLIGSKVARLPCGHLFHKSCIEGWLTKHCTCPVCRYELETDDPVYERERVERMRHRKPRFRKHELERLSIRHLRELCKSLKIDLNEPLFEKRELVDNLIRSGKIEMIASPEPVEYRISDLRALGVGKLRKRMNDNGVFFDSVDIVEKEDMVQIFINSGRVVLLPEDQMNQEENQEVNENMKQEVNQEALQSNLSNSDRSIDYQNTRQFSSSLNDTSSEISSLKKYLSKRTIQELKAMGRELHVDLYDCVEKCDMVDRLSSRCR